MTFLQLLVIGVHLIRMTKALDPISRLSNWESEAVYATVYFALKPIQGS